MILKLGLLMRYMAFLVALALSACDSSDNGTAAQTDEQAQSSATPSSEIGQTYTDANIAFVYPNTWEVRRTDQTGSILLTSQEPNEIGTTDACAVEFFSKPNTSLVELTLDYASNSLMQNPEPTISYTTVNEKEASRLLGYKQIGFSAAPAAVQIMYEKEQAVVFFCGTVDLDAEILLMFDSVVVQ